MIQLSNISELKKEDINKLVTLIQPELNKRKELYKRYKRKDKDYEIIQSHRVIVPFEKYIVDTASGYLGGKAPRYEVEEVNSEEKKNLVKKLLDKITSNKSNKEEMETLINYITNYNDDSTENYQLVKDILSTSACYEIVYENVDNEIVYSRLDPLQTVAIWDYSVPKQLIGIVNLYTEKDINNKTINVVNLTDKVGTRTFKSAGNSYEEVIQVDLEGNRLYNNHNFKDVPYCVVEIPDGTALFEPAIDLIKAYELLVFNAKNTFDYNDNAKLKITGFTPTEPTLTTDDDGNVIENPARKKEDEMLLRAKVFYTPDQSGDIDWITKDINDSAIQNTLKTYIDLIMMVTGVPQTTDLGFTKADNASAIDRKFFSLEQTTTQAMQLLKMLYQRRWELIFDRINLKKGTNYDFRDINITINKNLPANENEVVDMYMKLRGLISDDTIISRLPLNLDPASEMEKIESQEEIDLQKSIEKQKAFKEVNDENISNSDNNTESNSNNKTDNKEQE